VLEQLQAAPDTCSIPVVVLSADMHLLEEKRAWLHDRRISVLPKPFDLDALYDCLDRLLGAHQTPHDGQSIA
jgi:CheY-like chemotaxis protein